MSEEKDANELAARCPASDSRPDIRLLVLDIVGTIVRESNRIRESVIQAIHSVQRRGVEVALPTGRLYRSSLHAYESLSSTLPLICYEGALIREPNTGFVHRHWPFETRIAGQMLDYLARLTGATVCLLISILRTLVEAIPERVASLCLMLSVSLKVLGIELTRPNQLLASGEARKSRGLRRSGCVIPRHKKCFKAASLEQVPA
jgi:hypothetical protein